MPETRTIMVVLWYMCRSYWHQVCPRTMLAPDRNRDIFSTVEVEASPELKNL